MLAVGYNVLKKSITSIVKPNDAALTPAQQKNDQKDYVPTRPLVLFGHHWMSIAGTSPHHRLYSWTTLGLGTSSSLDGFWRPFNRWSSRLFCPYDFSSQRREINARCH